MKNDFESCPFCFNAYVYAKMPKTEEEEYFGTDLTDDNDGSSCGIGRSSNGFSIMFNSGMGKPCEIEFRKWDASWSMWNTVGYYYPKYCPECGRKLDEYIIGERGTSYDRKRTERRVK